MHGLREAVLSLLVRWFLSLMRLSLNSIPKFAENYVDFYYRTLSSAGSPVFPNVNSVNGWWNGISAWANVSSIKHLDVCIANAWCRPDRLKCAIH